MSSSELFQVLGVLTRGLLELRETTLMWRSSKATLFGALLAMMATMHQFSARAFFVNPVSADPLMILFFRPLVACQWSCFYFVVCLRFCFLLRVCPGAADAANVIFSVNKLPSTMADVHATAAATRETAASAQR